ncbi:MAG TPA: RnfH family protein [Burkholderiales bacterium]
MKIAVEVVYAMPQAQTVVQLELEEGATVEDALKLSGILAQHPEMHPATCRLGIWGRAVARSQPLRHRDRIEVYRPLVADPKLVRQKRAERERKRGR